jgi:putative tryptophan/tyrosine transport system substrate-binding protein
MRIRRCEVGIFFALLIALPALQAQPAGRMPRVALLSAGTSDCKPSVRDEAFQRSLLDLGYVTGKTIAVEHKCYRNSTEMRAQLADTVKSRADIIVVGVPAAAIAARGVTRDTPIVCASCGDPLDYGLVASLARPGGNVTGLASLSAELIGKRLELLKQVAPGVKRVAVLLNPDNPGTRANLQALKRAAGALNFGIEQFDFRKVDDFEDAFRSAASAGAGAVLVQDDPFTFAGRAQIGALGLKHRLPVIAGVSEVAEAGALIAYGPDRVDLYRRAAGFVDKIIKGAKPADLPIEQPSTFDLVINLRTAKALGVQLPQSLLTRASRVIQ